MEALVNTVFPNAELTEADVPDEDLVTFTRKPADDRYLQNGFITLSPEEPITSSTRVLTYNLQRSMLPRYLALNEILVAVNVSLQKMVDGSTSWVPAEAADNVAPSSLLHDILFEKVSGAKSAPPQVHLSPRLVEM